MSRFLERHFKKAFASLLRFLIGSHQVSVSPSDSFQKILVIRQHNQLGDMLCVVPLLRALRSKYPAAFIALMASPVNYDVMLHNRFVDEVIKFDKGVFLGRGTLRVGHLWRFIRTLRSRRFDLVIAPATVSTSFTTDLLSYMTGARARIGPGSLDGRGSMSSYLYSVPVDMDWRPTPHRHQALRNLDIAQPLHLVVDSLASEIRLTEHELNDAKSLLGKTIDLTSPIVALHPGAGKIPNRWAAQNFARVADSLAVGDLAQIVITAGPMDDDPIRILKESMKEQYMLLVNESVRRVASVLSLVDLVISNDTGIMHVAGAVGVPVLSLFGPTDPEQWAPAGGKSRYILGKGGDIGEIGVDDVTDLARRMLRDSFGSRVWKKM